MPQIPQISGPLTGGKTLTSGNSGNNTPSGTDPFSINGVNPVQRPTSVSQKGNASVGDNNRGVQGNLSGNMGVPVAKDPSMAVETLHDVFSGDLLENAKLNGYTELVGEIDDLTKAIYINPEKLMNEIMTQEKDNTVFAGHPLFDILRQISSESGEDTKELVANLLKSLNYAMSRNEIINAVKSNIRFLADYFGQNTTLSKNLNALYIKWDTGNPAENFEALKNETAALMRTVSGSLQNDSRTEVLVPLVTHNLSRYNTNEYMMKDAFSQLMSQVPSASARETLSKSFAEYVTSLLKANAEGRSPASAFTKDVSAEKAAVLIYLSKLTAGGGKAEEANNTLLSDSSASQRPQDFEGAQTRNLNNPAVALSQKGESTPQIRGGEAAPAAEGGTDGKGLQQLFDGTGRPVLDEKGNPVYIAVNNNGSSSDEIQGGRQPQDSAAGEESSMQASDGKGQPLLDSEGKPVLNQKGEPVFIPRKPTGEAEPNQSRNNGKLIFDGGGWPILNEKGEPVLIPNDRLAEKGQGRPVFDGEGRPILDQRGEPVYIKFEGGINGNSGQPVLDNSGQPVLDSSGQPVLDGSGHPVSDGSGHPVSDGAGQPIFDGSGQPVYNQDGKPIFIPQSLLSEKGQAIFDSSGRPVADRNGQPVLIDQNRTAAVGEGQQLFDGMGKPILNQEGKPVFIKADLSGARESKNADDRSGESGFDSAAYRRLVALSENRINYIVNNFKSGVMKGRDAIDRLVSLLIPRNAPNAADVMHTVIEGTDNLADMVNFLNKVLENTPDVPERQMLCDAFEDILGIMAKNQEMPTQKFTGYESETMKALTAFIDRNVNHPAIRGIDNFNASNLLQSMLNAPGVFTPLAHYIIPLQVEDTRAFGELWVDNDNSSNKSGEEEQKHFHLFLTFDVESVGRFEVDAYSKGSDLNLSVLYPKSYRYRVSSLTDKITKIAAGVGYNVQNFKTGILIKPHSLAETFPRIKDNRRSFDVKA